MILGIFSNPNIIRFKILGQILTNFPSTVNFFLFWSIKSKSESFQPYIPWNLSHARSSISLAFLAIPRNATSFFFSLFLTLISGLSLSILILLFNLSISLFLLSLNPQRLWVFQWASFHFFVGLLGFHLICLCILFRIIFNDLFWFCLYFLFVF